MPAPPGKPTPFTAAHGLTQQDKKNKVYIGPIYTGGTPTGGQQWVDLDVLKGQWQFMSDRATQKFMDNARRYKGWGEGSMVPMESLNSVWSEFVDLSYQIQQQTGEMVTPLEAYDWWAAKTGQRPQEQPRGGGGGGGGVSVTEQINFTDPSSARNFLEGAMAEYLGRRPDEDEFNAFAAALRRAERKNPTRTTAVSGGGRSRVVTKGGLDRAQFTQEFARSQEGVAETAAATTLLDTFLQTISE